MRVRLFSLVLGAFAALFALAPAVGSAQSTPAKITESGGKIWMRNSLFTIGFDESRGGALSSLVVGGSNVVNMYDDGRAVQTDFLDGNDTYDSCSGCTGTSGWNPVEAGDRYNHPSAIVAKSVGASLAYVKVRPNEWVPDNKGGGPTTPVPSDLQIEKWLTFVPGYTNVIKEHYRITNTGSVNHAYGTVGLVDVFTNSAFSRLVYYGGATPFAGLPETVTTLAPNGVSNPDYYTAEGWQGLVDRTGNGVSVYIPGETPYIQSVASNLNPAPGWSYNFFNTHSQTALSAGSVLEGDVYVLPGDYRAARQTIYGLHQGIPTPHPFGPVESADSPAPNQTIAATDSSFPVYGWAFDPVSPVTAVNIWVDGSYFGTAITGLPRPDVGGVFPSAPLNSGYSFSLDAGKLSLGAHSVSTVVVSADGKQTVVRTVTVTVT